jgi:hypothetical protein
MTANPNGNTLLALNATRFLFEEEVGLSLGREDGARLWLGEEEGLKLPFVQSKS